MRILFPRIYATQSRTDLAVQPIMVQEYVDKPPKHSFSLSLVKIPQDGTSDFLISLNLIAAKQKKVTQNSEKQLRLKNYWLQHHRDYQQEILIGQFLRYLQLGNQTSQLFTRIETCSFGQLSFLQTFMVSKLPFSQVALSILTENFAEEQA